MDYGGVDNLIDALHEIGRCGCERCHVDPNLFIGTGNGNVDKVIIKFDMPDRQISVSGPNIDQACKNAIKNMNVLTGVKS